MAAANPFAGASISVGKELAEVAEQLRRCTVEVRTHDSGRGSGVVWRPDGLIITNAHVASSPRNTVRLADGRSFDAELVRRNPRLDLAALRIRAAELSSARLRNPSSLRPGELVIAIGNPQKATGALAMGMVSVAPKEGEAFMSADIRLAPGNSGGPLADVYGNIVGINSMIVGGFGVAICSTAVEAFLSDDRRIGVTVRPIAVVVEPRPVLGLMVLELEPGSPAEAAGMLSGDIVVRADGASLHSPEQLSRAIRNAKHVLFVEVMRAGRMQVCEIPVAGKSATEAA